MDIGRITREFPAETHVESYAQTDTDATDEDNTMLHLDMGECTSLVLCN